MQIREIMTRDVQMVSPQDTVEQAARMMSDFDVGALPVSQDDKLIGMITDRDIAIRAVAEGKSPKECRVRDIMSSGVKYVFEDQETDDLAHNIGDLQMRRLPVVSRDKRLVGIVSLGDLAVGAADQAKQALSDVSQPVHH